MKEYLKTHNPRVTLILIGLLFISNILVLFIPSLRQAVLLYPSNLNEPMNWYRFITYPLYVGGLLSWFHNAVVLYFTGLIFEVRLTKRPTILIIFISVLIGGLVAIILNQGDPINRPIASPSMISWGYWSTAIVTGIFYWKSTNLLEKIILGLCIVSLLSINNPDHGFLIGQIVVIVVIAVIAIPINIKMKNRP